MRFAVTLIAIAGLGLAGTVQAQRVRYDGALWPAADRTDPTRLPGEAIPPAAADFLKPARTKPGPTPAPVTTPHLAIDLALEAAQAAIDACRAQGRAVAAAVTDADGVLQLGMSADGAAPPGRIYAGVNKALVALAFGKPSSVVRDEIRAEPSRGAEIKPNMMLLAGALPIVAGGHIVGAIGVSGASSAQDEGCAKAGLARIADRLK